MPAAAVPLTALDLTGVAALRALVSAGMMRCPARRPRPARRRPCPTWTRSSMSWRPVDPGAVLVMGKGGVGKTTIAAALAVGLAHRGHEVHLSTTDPAGRLTDVLLADAPTHLTVSRIDPAAELARYTTERLPPPERLDPDRRALLEEDLRSPCTEELAVFRGVLQPAQRGP